MQIKEILNKGITTLKKSNIEDAEIKSRIILSNLLGKTKEYLMIHYEQEINDNLFNIYMEKIQKIIDGIPLQYLINEQEFMGFEFCVDENVLIPQPDTENLVEEVIKLSEKCKTTVRDEVYILDLCTGSGAIAVSLSKLIYNSKLYASDISEKAIKIAELNSIKNMSNVLFIKSDMFENISSLYRFNIIVSNPPYIETEVIKTLSKEVQNEPHIALDGGKDGLVFYRQIAENAKNYLVVNGYLALEIGYNQRESVEKILKDNGYRNIYSKKDLSGNDRVIVAQK